MKAFLLLLLFAFTYQNSECDDREHGIFQHIVNNTFLGSSAVYSQRHCNALDYDTSIKTPDGTFPKSMPVKCCYVEVENSVGNYRGCILMNSQMFDRIGDDLIDELESNGAPSEMNSVTQSLVRDQNYEYFKGTSIKVLDCSSKYIFASLFISLFLLL